ncbi:MAG TPA: hypothetical protein DCS93_10000 [Microscillaceae bacterium]|nr:hypothetical protein [Microscillaceae bacterium]
MKIYFSVKRLGKKRPFIDRKTIEIEGNYQESYALQTILTQIVTQQVNEFNQRREEKSLFTFLKEDALTEENIKEEAATGQVKFGAIYNAEKAQLEKAIETVLLAFEDGLIAVFVNDDQIEDLSQLIMVDENTVFTFVRLTFLVGRSW